MVLCAVIGNNRVCLIGLSQTFNHFSIVAKKMVSYFNFNDLYICVCVLHILLLLYIYISIYIYSLTNVFYNQILK